MKSFQAEGLTGDGKQFRNSMYIQGIFKKQFDTAEWEMESRNLKS